MLKQSPDALSRIDDWSEFLDMPHAGLPEYVYPVGDRQLGLFVESQDPKHRTTEEELIAALTAGDWTVAVDFGCGEGGHLKLFDDASRLVIGIEPDEARSRMAADRAADSVKKARAAVLHGDATLLGRAASKGHSADRVLCAHVLGHVTAPERGRILTALKGILAPDGRCLLFAPVVGPDFAENLHHAGGWTGDADYTHIVDKGVAPTDPDYRTHISVEAFDAAARYPAPAQLPVCCFLLRDFPDPAGFDGPVTLDALPPTLEEMVGQDFTVEDAKLFSVHRDGPGHNWPIGSMSLLLSPKGA